MSELPNINFKKDTGQVMTVNGVRWLLNNPVFRNWKGKWTVVYHSEKS
ncbi:hypothetical protein [Persicitalea jodogahamensis]|nr:hypothetical protein [Persicitalea jodogahamensis]